MKIEDLIRPNIKQMKPYSSARDEFSGAARVFLDANENPFDLPYNRYPDPHQTEIKQLLARIRNVLPAQIFLGNGSDEPIDLVIRMCCVPGVSNLVILDPTYGMYAVSAEINDIEIRRARLTPDFELDPDAIRQATDSKTRLLFLCSPNNPSGNTLDTTILADVIRNFPGIVVLDEAYADFSNLSFIPRLSEFPNLIILQTFSKAWGMAGLRVGVAYASPLLIGYLDKIKPPYNINQVSQLEILRVLQTQEDIRERISEIRTQREKLAEALKNLPCTERIYPSQANFLLVRFRRSAELFTHLLDSGIIVRDRSRQLHCENCLRITVGTPEENAILVDAINAFK